MKKLYILIASIAFAIAAIGQPATSAYLNKIPSLPKDSCNITKTGSDNFSNQVSNLMDQIEKDTGSAKRNFVKKTTTGFLGVGVTKIIVL